MELNIHRHVDGRTVVTMHCYETPNLILDLRNGADKTRSIVHFPHEEIKPIANAILNRKHYHGTRTEKMGPRFPPQFNRVLGEIIIGHNKSGMQLIANDGKQGGFCCIHLTNIDRMIIADTLSEAINE